MNAETVVDLPAVVVRLGSAKSAQPRRSWWEVGEIEPENRQLATTDPAGQLVVSQHHRVDRPPSPA
jgi:hypothetical protein